MIQKECFEKEFIESRRSAIALYFCLKIQTFLELPKEMPFFHITTKPPRKGWLRYMIIGKGGTQKEPSLLCMKGIGKVAL